MGNAHEGGRGDEGRECGIKTHYETVKQQKRAAPGGKEGGKWTPLKRGESGGYIEREDGEGPGGLFQSSQSGLGAPARYT